MSDLLKVIERRLDRVEKEVTKPNPEFEADLKAARELVAEARRSDGGAAAFAILKLGMLLERLGVKFDKGLAPRIASREKNRAKGKRTKSVVLKKAKQKKAAGVPKSEWAGTIAAGMSIGAAQVRRHLNALIDEGEL